jgi:hypothetical protein
LEQVGEARQVVRPVNRARRQQDLLPEQDAGQLVLAGVQSDKRQRQVVLLLHRQAVDALLPHLLVQHSAVKTR